MPGKPRSFVRLANGSVGMTVVDDRSKARTIIVPRSAEAAFSLDFLAMACTSKPFKCRNWSNDSYQQGEP